MVQRVEERRIRAGEADIGAPERAIAGDRIGTGRVGLGVHRRDDPAEAFLGQRGDQGVPIREVAARRRVRHLEIPRETAQAQSFEAALRDHFGRPLEQGLLQIAVVVCHVFAANMRSRGGVVNGNIGQRSAPSVTRACPQGIGEKATVRSAVPYSRVMLPRSPLFHLALCLALLFPGAARAGIAHVYHSPADDGVPPASVPIESGGPMVTLFLYVDAGATATTTGTPCVDGDGDELCAFEFRLQTGGDAAIEGFVPDPGVDVVQRTSANEFAVVGGDAIDGTPGPIRVGALDLTVGSPAWNVVLGSGSSIDAGFTLTPIDAATLAAPEPIGPAPGALAVLLLLYLAARRRRAAARAMLVGVAMILVGGANPATAQDADGDGPRFLGQPSARRTPTNSTSAGSADSSRMASATPPVRRPERRWKRGPARRSALPARSRRRDALTLLETSAA